MSTELEDNIRKNKEAEERRRKERDKNNKKVLRDHKIKKDR
jgi:hypothetical protein